LSQTDYQPGSSFRAPLVWILFPWITGIVLVPWLRFIPEIFLWSGAALFLLLTDLSIHSGHRENWSLQWSLFFVISVVLTSSCIQSLRFPIPDQSHAWMSLPPREAFLELEIQKLEFSPDAQHEGVARFDAIVLSGDSSTIPIDSIGMLRCMLWKPMDLPTLVEGARLRARGVIYNHLLSSQPFMLYRNGTILEIESMGENKEPSLRGRICTRITQTLQLGAPEGSRLPSYIQSIVTGDKRYLDYVDKEQFKTTGVMHFLAISGFHLSVIALMLYTLLQIVRFPHQWIALITLAACSFYVWMTGASVSAQRALLMLAMFFAARYVRRKPDLLAATAAAAWIVILISPKQLSSPGYQLSFLIVTGIIAHAIPLQRLLVGRSVGDPFLSLDSIPRYRRWLESCKIYFIASFSVSWTAFWISLPVVCWYFGNEPFPAIILNTLLAPLFALALVAGVLSAMFGFFYLFAVSEFINHAIWVLMTIINQLIDSVSLFPWLIWKKEGNAVVALCSVGILLFLMLGFDASRKRNRWVYGAIPVLSLGSVLLQDQATKLF
jgi:competence protein ComEC